MRNEDNMPRPFFPEIDILVPRPLGGTDELIYNNCHGGFHNKGGSKTRISGAQNPAQRHRTGFPFARAMGDWSDQTGKRARRISIHLLGHTTGLVG